MNEKELKRTLTKKYFSQTSLVKQQLDSYNAFIDKISAYVKTLPPIEVENEQLPIDEETTKMLFEIKDIELEKPSMEEAYGKQHLITPMEALIRNLTYASKAYFIIDQYIATYKIHREKNNIAYEQIEKKYINRERVYIGDIPVMIKSKLCNLYQKSEKEQIEMGFDPLDPGGYFIINGTERVLIGIEDLVPNKILVEVTKAGDYTAKVFSAKKNYRAKCVLIRKLDGMMYLDFPHSVPQLNILVVLRALGMSFKEIMEEYKKYDKVVYNDFLLNYESLREDLKEQLDKDPVGYLANRLKPNQSPEIQLAHFNNVMMNYLLPHLNSEQKDQKEIFLTKAKYIIRMSAKASLSFYGKIKPDDRDHYGNKRVRLVGDLMEELFIFSLDALLKDIKKKINNKRVRNKGITSFKTLVKSSIFTDKILYSMSTGNWIAGQTGISQVMDRTSLVGSISNRRRIISPLEKSFEFFKARDLHGTWYGKICPSETPEGQSASLVKNLALMAEITTETIEKEKLLKSINEVLEQHLHGSSEITLYIDGESIYNVKVKDPKKFLKSLKDLRREGKISHSINFYYNEYFNELHINTSPGRLRRPYLIVENGRLIIFDYITKLDQLSWEDLVNITKKLPYACIEYLDAEEEENTYIAKKIDEISNKHTHLEIDPSTIFGIAAGLLPYSEYNSSPRLTMASGMLKQSIGLYSAAFNYRYDTKGYVMFYPEKPLVKNAVYDYLTLEKRPAGHNLVVAVLSYKGYNMADAVIFNKSAIERGLGRTLMYKTYETEVVRYPGGLTDKLTKPTPDSIGYKGPEAYEKLDEDGLPKIDSEVDENHVIIGKLSPPRFIEESALVSLQTPNQDMRDSSVKLKEGEHGRVDKVIITESQDGYKLLKVRIRMYKIPEIGDKFSSRHGQKGVIGMIVDQKDLPFTKDGIVPDLIINPHAIPSRMTAGHLIEMIGGKLACLSGKYIDSTPFSGDKAEDIIKELKSYGFDEWGEEELYDGITGQKMKVKIFVGVIYYQRLHHLVSNKIHSRTRGPVQMLTSQPTEGRSREGGLRFGEMERDTLFGHGVSAITLDRLLHNSDKKKIYVCKSCGSFAYYDHNKQKYVCPICSGDIVEIDLPQTFKLFLDELTSIHIYPKLKIKKRGEDDGNK
jgi:DNA-directed RNA polymerase subunit B